jgi:hypothetical protein
MLAPQAYLWLGLALVVVSVVILEFVYGLSPVPPGVDSGDWAQRSFAWVGLAHPPMDAVGSPYLYSPAIFPLLGITVLATGGPLTADFVFGGALLVALGLTTVHLARRFFVDGPVQVLFVGLMLFNGTTFSILFWGGYPNFLAFVVLNECLLLLLLFLRTRTLRDGLLFWGMTSLLYLTHDLTFAVFAATVAVMGLFLVVLDRRWFGVILSRANVAGMAVLAVTIAGYIEITGYLQIPHPGYIASNPAAHFVDNIGEIFQPLSSGPMFLPGGPAVDVTPAEAMAILGAAAVALVVIIALVGSRRPEWLDSRHYLATATFAAACGVPVAGYLIGVDTDFTRFVYFLTLPICLGVGLLVEGAVRSRLHPVTSSSPEAAPSGSGRPRTWRPVYALVGVLVVLVLLIANVTIPSAISNEQSEAGSDHDAAYLQAIQWLNADARPGSVLTTAGAVRWTEALTDRGAFDIGPTWLLFEPWQVTNAEEAYFALNSQTALTNNAEVLSFSGFNTTALEQAPMYSAFIEGVQFPLLRVLPQSIFANASSGAGFTPTPVFRGPVGVQETIPGPGANSGLITYSTPLFSVAEVGAMGPDEAWVNFTVSPSSGDQVNAFNFSLATPPAGSTFLHPPASTGDWWNGSALAWNDTGVLGQYPGNYPMQSWVVPSPAPGAPPNITAGPLNNAIMSFPNPHPSSPFTVSLRLWTAGTSNPAVVLPPVMNGSTFLAEHDIHYLLIPNLAGFTPTANYYESVYQFSVKFQNAEWTVLEG